MRVLVVMIVAHSALRASLHLQNLDRKKFRGRGNVCCAWTCSSFLSSALSPETLVWIAAKDLRGSFGACESEAESEGLHPGFDPSSTHFPLSVITPAHRIPPPNRNTPKHCTIPHTTTLPQCILQHSLQNLLHLTYIQIASHSLRTDHEFCCCCLIA
jgi:hypothetical protein